MLEKRHIFYCNNLFPAPQTGGEFFYSKILDYIKKQDGVEVILPNKSDLYYLNRPANSFKINGYFIKRFMHLPKKTIILENESFYYAFFIANWFIRIFRKDIKILASFRQVSSPLLVMSKAKIMRDIILFLYVHSAHIVTVNSRYLSNILKKDYKVTSKKIKVVYSSCRVTGRIRENREKNKKEPIIILCVANIRKLKGQIYLAEALNKIMNYNWKCFLVGGIKEQEYEHELKSLIKKYGLSDRVDLCGRLDGYDLVKMYEKADIFVLPSLYESYGVVIHEGLSFALPIIASNVGGIPEQITNSKEGIIVPPRDSMKLAEALRRLICSQGLRKKMGVYAKERAEELPTWDEVCKRIFQSIISISTK